MSIFAELKSKLWLDWEMCRNNALFELPILMSLLCSFKWTWRFWDVSPMYLSLQSLQGIQQTPATKNMLRWGLECTNSQIVLEGKEVVLILSLFKFVMLWEEEFYGKVRYLWGELVLLDIEWELVWVWFLLCILKLILYL